MKRLLLLRHAKAASIEGEDFVRPLASRGRDALPPLAHWMQRRELKPDLVLCSPALRTRETWSLLKEQMELECEVRFLESLYCATAPTLLARIRAVTDNADQLLLIGHNPGIELLALNLSTLESKPKKLARMTSKFPTGALAVFEADIGNWGELDTSGARLVDFIRPSDLN